MYLGLLRKPHKDSELSFMEGVAEGQFSLTVIRMKSSVNDFTQIVAIIGSRTHSEESQNRVGKLVHHLMKDYDNHILVVSGGAVTGADYWAKYICSQRKIPYLEATAFWRPAVNHRYAKPSEYDNTAGHTRNRIIARICTKMVAFWDGKSPGTGGAMKYARMIGKPVEIVDISVVHPLDQLSLPKSPPIVRAGGPD